MGYYASGDTQKTIHNSEEDEGYGNQLTFTISADFSRLGVRNKRNFPFEESPERLSSVPVPAITDDTDRPFWAEDELSASESRQQINNRQKRRRSSSYRNQIAVRRSRPLLFQSSSSSIDSIVEQISPEVCKQEEYNQVERFIIRQRQADCSVSKKEHPSKTITSLTIKAGNLYSKRKGVIKKYLRRQDSPFAKKKIKHTSSSGSGSHNH